MTALTSRVPGNGTSTLSYTIPGAGLDVETVRAVVDASGAGGAVTATVTITDQSGVVIATKSQTTTIPAGVVGSATWALRLDDDASAVGGGAIQFDVSPQQGNFLDVETVGPSLFGTVILDNGPGGLYLRSLNNGFLLIQAAQQCLIEAIRLTMFSEGDIELNLDQTLTQVVMNDSSLNPIFEVHEDGTIHGRAAIGAITWDL